MVSPRRQQSVAIPPSGRGCRILLVRLSSIGDVVHGLPLLCALRDALPEAHLAWIVEDLAAVLLEGHSALDEIIRLPRRWFEDSWYRPAQFFATLRQLRRQFKSRSFDVAIDVQGLTRSALTAWMSGAAHRIGFDGVDGRQQSRWFNNVLVEPRSTRVVERNLELLRPLGVAAGGVHFRLPDYPTETARMEHFLKETGLERGRFVLVAPGSARAERLWPAERFAAVATKIGERYHIPSAVLWAGSRERRWAREICDGSGGHAWVAPPTSLTELAVLARCASLFIGADTGPLHIAAAVGCSCVSLHGPTSAGRTGPYGPQHIAIQSGSAPSPAVTRPKNRPSMKAISVEEVCEACDTVLKR